MSIYVDKLLPRDAASGETAKKSGETAKKGDLSGLYETHW
jgi:hypothetical protein